MMRVLAAFGRRGATAGPADMIGNAFSDAEFGALVSPAGDGHNLGDIDAVVVVDEFEATGRCGDWSDG